MKTLSTTILIIGALMLAAGYLGMGPRDIDQTAIGVMVFAGVLHMIWGRDGQTDTNSGQPG